jgi:hypothetical protein
MKSINPADGFWQEIILGKYFQVGNAECGVRNQMEPQKKPKNAEPKNRDLKRNEACGTGSSQRDERYLWRGGSAGSRSSVTRAG